MTTPSQAAIWIEINEDGTASVRAVADPGTDAETWAYSLVSSFVQVSSGGKGAYRVEGNDDAGKRIAEYLRGEEGG